MSGAAAFVAATLRARLPRVLGILALAALFLGSGAATAAFFRDEQGHVALGELFAVGGYPLASALLLLGWLIGRFPMIAMLVLAAGLVSADRAHGYARLYTARPGSPVLLYGARFVTYALLVFALSAVLLPLFDLMLIGEWAGPSTLVLIAAQILVYGGLTALFSVWTRGDAWVALALGILAIAWEAAVRGGALFVPPGPRAVVGLLLPPQWAMLRLEEAFGALQPVPWDAFAWAAGYGLAALLVAAVALSRREL